MISSDNERRQREMQTHVLRGSSSSVMEAGKRKHDTAISLNVDELDVQRRTNEPCKALRISASSLASCLHRSGPTAMTSRRESGDQYFVPSKRGEWAGGLTDQSTTLENLSSEDSILHVPLLSGRGSKEPKEGRHELVVELSREVEG